MTRVFLSLFFSLTNKDIRAGTRSCVISKFKKTNVLYSVGLNAHSIVIQWNPSKKDNLYLSCEMRRPKLRGV